MSKIRRIFTDHPATVGETYTQHLVAALGFSIHMLSGAVCCLVHAILPFLFERTGSGKIERLHAAMIANRRRAGGIEFSQDTESRTDEPQHA